MIPLLATAILWGTPYLFRNFPFSIALLGALFSIALGLILIRKKFEPRTVVAIGAILCALLSTQLALMEAKNSSNHPSQLAGKEFEMVDVDVQLDARLSDGFWAGRMTSIGGTKQNVDTLISVREDATFQIGCQVGAMARLIPNDDPTRPWLLKLQSSAQSESCSQQGFASVLRGNFMQRLSGVSTESAALVAGLSIGDTSTLTAALDESMKKLSLTHLTAVSGANCAIVLGLVFFVLGFLGLRRWQRVLIAIVCMFGYVQLVGPQPSVLRAATMTGVIVLLTATGRSITPISALAHASSILLLVEPAMAFSLGFALSVAATGGILILTPWIYSKLKSRTGKALAAMISVSLAAQIWCTPILLQLQGGIPTYSLLANVLVEPAVFPITVLGITACILCAFWAPAASLITYLASIPAEYIVVVAGKLAQFPYAMLWWPTGTFGVAMMVLIVCAVTLLAMNKRRRLAAGLLAIAIVVVSGSGSAVIAKVSAWPVANWQIANCNVGQGDALVIRSQEKVAVVDVGREDQLIDDCLNRLSIRTIDLLVLTHFDADHIGGLAGALKNRAVGDVLLSSFKDDRVQASITEMQVRAKARRVVKANAGQQGRLGQIDWLVLQPETAGFGSEDSNDGSIAMRWESSEFVLFTLADLGERGQMRMSDLHPDWIAVDNKKPLVLKVSHHGSADQFPELTEYWKPTVALISVGRNNGYGHPTSRTLNTLLRVNSQIFRTDLNGAISIASNPADNGLKVATGG